MKRHLPIIHVLLCDEPNCLLMKRLMRHTERVTFQGRDRSSDDATDNDATLVLSSVTHIRTATAPALSRGLATFCVMEVRSGRGEVKRLRAFAWTKFFNLLWCHG